MPDYTDTSRLDLTNEYTIFRWFMRQRASRGREREVNNVVSFSISHKNRPVLHWQINRTLQPEKNIRRLEYQK